MEMIQKLARRLRAKQQSQEPPYNLVLSPSLSLTPQVRHAVCGSDNWEDFKEKLNTCSPTERRALLVEPLSKLKLRQGYECLAQLVQNGFFNVIFTLNVDDVLDQVVQTTMLPHECRIYSLGEIEAKTIVMVLSEKHPRVKVIKLRGDINTYRLTPEGWFEFPDKLEQKIKELLARDTIIVGDIADFDNDIQRCISTRNENGALWVVVPEKAKGFIKRTKQARQNGEVIVFSEGELIQFFCALSSALNLTPKSRPVSTYPAFPTILRLPAPPQPFIGRQTEIDTLAEILLRDGVLAISGMPGIGKSAIAKKLAQHLRSKYPTQFPGRMFWINLEDHASAEAIWAQIASFLGYSLSAESENFPFDKEAGSTSISTLLTDHRSLLIIDSAELAPKTVDALMKARGNSLVLITTQDRGLAARYGTLYPLSPPSPNDAVKLFRSRNKFTLQDTPEEVKIINQVCKTLGYLPLAIEQAAIYVATYNTPIAEYLDLLNKRKLRDILYPNEYSSASAFTFERIWENLEKDKRRVLAVMSLAAEEDVELEAIAVGLALEELTSTYDRVNHLVSRSLIDRATTIQSSPWEQAAFTIHPFMRRYVIESFPMMQQKEIRTKLAGYYFGRQRFNPITISGSGSQPMIFQIGGGTDEGRHQPVPPDSMTAKTHYNRALALYKQQQYEEALASFTRAIQLDSCNALAYENRGLTYIKLQHYGKALDDFNKVLQLDSDNAKAYAYRGNVYEKLQRDEEALADYSQSIQLGPQNAEAYFNRGSVYEKLKRYKEALKDYSQVIQLDISGATYYASRRAIYEKPGRYDEALFHYLQKHRLDPSHTELHFGIGLLLANRGALREALSHFEKAAQLGHAKSAEYAIQTKQKLNQ